METEVRHENNITTVSIKGSVDALTAAEVTKTINNQIADDHVNLVIDLTGLVFMSSAGLRALLGAVKESRSHGGDLRIVSTNLGIDKVLKMSGFHNIAKVFTSQADATESFG
ncbi:MAG TPA: STAS domain-containing protein [Anaerolineales bacterium]|jgi:anti-sigma B factor antagonist|nr:STAS domain-containing protein [Anaerolineales bacterium]